jgi:hypothetical protein
MTNKQIIEDNKTDVSHPYFVVSYCKELDQHVIRRSPSISLRRISCYRNLKRTTTLLMARLSKSDQVGKLLNEPLLSQILLPLLKLIISLLINTRRHRWRPEKLFLLKWDMDTVTSDSIHIPKQNQLCQIVNRIRSKLNQMTRNNLDSRWWKYWTFIFASLLNCFSYKNE